MKKFIGIVKRHAMMITFAVLLLIIGGGIFWLHSIKKDIGKMEGVIKTKYAELKKYEIDKSTAPSPELINTLTEQRDMLQNNFKVMMAKFSTSYPAPPTYDLFPAVEFKEFLFSTQDYLAKKARKRKVTIPSNFGFPETGLPPEDQIPIMSLKLEVVKKLVDLTIDSGVSFVNTITPGEEKSVAFYKTLPLQMTINGTSTEIVRFLKYLENPSSFFVLDSFSLSRSDDNGLFKADMVVSAIMLQTAAPSAPAAAQQPAPGPPGMPPPVPGGAR